MLGFPRADFPVWSRDWLSARQPVQKEVMSSQRFVPDYYEILQVHPKASLAVIKKAYRALMLDLGQHPDRGGDAQTASLITEAYQVLSSTERRAAYDAQYFKQNLPPGRAAGETASPQPPQSPPPRPQPRPAPPQQASKTPPVPPRAPTGAIVSCPRCQSKNRVRNTQRLDQARCHECSQTLKGSTPNADTVLERVQERLDGFVEMLEARFPVLKRFGEKPGNGKVGWVWGAAIPVALMLLSGALITYVLNDNNFTHDNPIVRAEQLQQTQSYPQAEALLNEAIAKDRANPRLHEKLGDILVKQRNLERALEEFDKAIVLGPENAWVHTLKGQTCLQLGRVQEAESAFKKALALDRTQAGALEALGQMRLRNGRFPDAIEYLKRAAEANPSADNFVYLGTAHQATQRYRDAEVAFLQALSLTQTHLLGLKHLGDVYLVQKKYKDALEPLKKAYELTPTDGDLCAKLASCYAQLGDRTRAREAWNQCIALSLDNPIRQQLAKQALETLTRPPSASTRRP